MIRLASLKERLRREPRAEAPDRGGHTQMAPAAPDNRALRRAKVGAVILGGVVVLGIAGAVRFTTSYNDLRQRAADTVDYVRDQSLVYDAYNEATVSKSLARAVENAGQVARNLCYVRDFSQEDLGKFANELTLTGIAVLGENGEVEVQYHSDGADADYLSKVINDSMLECAHYPKKKYAERVMLEDGSTVDVSAAGRQDAPGLVVTFYKTEAPFATTFNLSMQNMLKGYTNKSGRFIVVEEDGEVIAANDTALGTSLREGDQADYSLVDTDVVDAIKDEGECDELVCVRNNGQDYFGMMSRARNYYVYVFQSASSVSSAVAEALLIGAVVYGAFIGIVVTMARHADRERLAQRLEAEELHHKELTLAVERAEAANAAKTDFLQRMSHDIRTPINGVLGMVEIAEACANDPAKQAECRREVRNAGKLLLDLINEILDITKLEGGEIVLEDRVFDMTELEREVIDVVSTQAGERNIEIVQDPSSEIEHAYVHGSPLHVKRCVLNVLSNAVKYNVDGGKIYLSLVEKPGVGETSIYTLTCTDTGIGMSAEFQPHLFEPYARELGRNTGVREGTGLGMPIAKRLAEAMGGDITFSSVQGKGSTFVVSLPLRAAEASEIVHDEETDEEALRAIVAGLKVLVVEDNRLNRDIAVFMCEGWGMEVSCAEDGGQAVDAFEQSEPKTFDAVLMDVMMPVVDGYEATRKIRASGRPDAAIPIIGMSANAFSDDRLRAKEAGMDDYLAKPIDTVILLKTLARHCAHEK